MISKPNFDELAMARWEECGGRKLSPEEETAFKWGYTYGAADVVKDLLEASFKK